MQSAAKQKTVTTADELARLVLEEGERRAPDFRRDSRLIQYPSGVLGIARPDKLVPPIPEPIRAAFLGLASKLGHDSALCELYHALKAQADKWPQQDLDCASASAAGGEVLAQLAQLHTLN